MNTGLQINTVQKDQCIMGFTNRRGRTGTILLYSIVLHDPLKIQQHLTKLVHQLCPDLSCCIGITSKIQPMPHMVQQTNPILHRKLIDLQIYFITSDINCSKYPICHR